MSISRETVPRSVTSSCDDRRTNFGVRNLKFVVAAPRAELNFCAGAQSYG